MTIYNYIFIWLSVYLFFSIYYIYLSIYLFILFFWLFCVVFLCSVIGSLFYDGKELRFFEIKTAISDVLSVFFLYLQIFFIFLSYKLTKGVL